LIVGATLLRRPRLPGAGTERDLAGDRGGVTGAQGVEIIAGLSMQPAVGIDESMACQRRSNAVVVRFGLERTRVGSVPSDDARTTRLTEVAGYRCCRALRMTR
jgi:hypothetical protein